MEGGRRFRMRKVLNQLKDPRNPNFWRKLFKVMPWLISLPLIRNYFENTGNYKHDRLISWVNNFFWKNDYNVYQHSWNCVIDLATQNLYPESMASAEKFPGGGRGTEKTRTNNSTIKPPSTLSVWCMKSQACLPLPTPMPQGYSLLKGKENILNIAKALQWSLTWLVLNLQ